MNKLLARVVSRLPVRFASLVTLEIAQKTLLYSRLSMPPNSMGGNVAIIVVVWSNWRSKKTAANFQRCHCSAQFCYICGERWKTCTCAQWNEDRLIARANQVVARQPVRVDPPQQAARIAAVVQNLRDRHNCDHQSWQYIRGSHQCEECRHELPSYIFECRQCNIQACNRCRRNRL
jgi:hypothetical protein